VGASIRTFQLCYCTFTMTEVWAWGRWTEELVDGAESPWDDKRLVAPAMRTSVERGGRDRWLRRFERLSEPITEAENQAFAERLLGLAA
jgi:hypothetical protein